MRLLKVVILSALLSAPAARAALLANFRDTSLVITDGGHETVLRELVDQDSFHATLHSIQKRGDDYFVVFGSSEMTRGWPPKGGFCGCGIESYIRWLRIRDGKVIEEQEGLYESCRESRDGWRIAWTDHRLKWSSEGFRREKPGKPLESTPVAFTWTYDPAKPEQGITEVIADVRPSKTE